MNAPFDVPFNRPSLLGNELVYMKKALDSGHISGDGPFTRKCHEFLERELSVPRVLLTTSCTHALEMCALLLNIQPGDEVIVPSFTFVTTANAFVLRGGTPVFADIRPDTLNVDESKIEPLITARTKAIVVMHYAGVGCEMDAILDIANQHGIPIIEDNAQGLFGKYKRRDLGTLGRLATLSFHGTKNITCGEGGALLVNDPAYTKRAEIVREKGTNRSQFFRGQVDKYTWVDIGSSYLPSDILAACLYAQLESYREIQSSRRQLWETYHEQLQDWAHMQDIQLPFIPEYCDQTYHVFYLLLPSLNDRQSMIAHLRERGVQGVFHYLPLHLSAMGRQLGWRVGDCPITEDISDRLLRLPLYNGLTELDQQQVIEAVLEFSTDIAVS